MSETHKTYPAFPAWELNGQGKPEMTCFGLTVREYAAIKLKVPDSGTAWLDEMITKSLKNDFAGKAMQGICNGRSHSDLKGHTVASAKVAYEVSDAMLKAGES